MWWQWLSGVVPVCLFGWLLEKGLNKDRADTQAKIDRIWKHMSELEERARRHSDWNRAICEKMMYDKERGYLRERLERDYNPVHIEGDGPFDLMFRKDEEIRRRLDELFPEKKTSDFLE
ncbi:hypothetical protein [Lelliottia nimipressuralis]|uniref:Phage protein n=1 Tax=Lelliottia nimipressuralis TaxID=69220 RepID=A0ABD4KCL8_9ENTR|nr:hypothetical protein [Lelliottia nimipressuralis]MBF4179678.1 hypothetical protein [Lelliottia nimipressuralis]